MCKHIFLEGPIQEGKSTLLRKLLVGYMDQVGGFTSQRLTNSDGITVGFRICPADSPITAIYNNSMSGVFHLMEPDGNKYVDLNIFESKGIEYLSAASGYRLILLDEIGGSELLLPAFRHKLYNVLSTDTHCIGVIKSRENTVYMSKNLQIGDELIQYNDQLHNDIVNRFNGRILAFRRNDKKIIKEIEDYLCGIFTTK